VATDRTRTEVLAWYTLVGSFATALGALAAGMATHALHDTAPTSRYRPVVILYAAIGAALALLFSRLSRAAEATGTSEQTAGRTMLARLAGSTDRATSWQSWRRCSHSTRSPAASSSSALRRIGSICASARTPRRSGRSFSERTSSPGSPHYSRPAWLRDSA